MNLSTEEPTEAALDSRGGLGLLRVVGGGGCGLSGECVHGAQELVSDASCLSEPAEQGAVNCGWVIPDGVLTGKEQARDRLRRRESAKCYRQCAENREV